MTECFLCPRACGARRAEGALGACGEGEEMRIARIALHPYEEPPISGKNGSGAVFFCGCPLHCVFCQNKAISRGGDGRPYSSEELADELLRLEALGAANINLVTPTHFTDGIIKTLERVKPRLSVPVVYNTSGYESVRTLRELEGLVDVYMPDFKYASSELAEKYSHASDYPSVAEKALCEMYRQVGEYRIGEDGTLKRGLLVRHLVLPSHRADSIAVLRRIAELLPVGAILLSLMSQYTPDFALDCEYKELHRRVTRFEYEAVLAVAEELGFDGFRQSRTSAEKKYTPNF